MQCFECLYKWMLRICGLSVPVSLPLVFGMNFKLQDGDWMRLLYVRIQVLCMMINLWTTFLSTYS